MSDTLLQRVAGGDAGAMQECIDTYSGLVWSLARRLSISMTEAEDAVQEVFIALWENADRYDPNLGEEVTFVAMITRRRLIDRGRKRQRRDKLLDRVREMEDPLPPTEADPIATGDDASRALAALDDLSENQQQVLGLAIHYGLTHEQIARHTGMPLGTVKTHARRGLLRVRERLHNEDADQSVGHPT